MKNRFNTDIRPYFIAADYLPVDDGTSSFLKKSWELLVENGSYYDLCQVQI